MLLPQFCFLWALDAYDFSRLHTGLYLEIPGLLGDLCPLITMVFFCSFTMFAAPFLSLSAMMAVAPIFSAPGFNFRTRASAAVLLAALVAPSLPAPPFDNIFSGIGLVVSITELGVGLVMGFVLQLAFCCSFCSASSIYDHGSGVCNGGRSSKWSSGARNCSSSVRHFDDAIIFVSGRSFSPDLGRSGVLQNCTCWVTGYFSGDFSRVTALGSIVFTWGMLMALPILTALLFINVALGVVTRAAPQLNIFAVGFPVTIISGLLIMFIVMPVYVDVMTRLIEVTVFESLRILSSRRVVVAEEQLGQERSEQPTSKRLKRLVKKGRLPGREN